jgi:hypothetical protein
MIQLESGIRVIPVPLPFHVPVDVLRGWRLGNATEFLLPEVQRLFSRQEVHPTDEQDADADMLTIHDVCFSLSFKSSTRLRSPLLMVTTPLQQTDCKRIVAAIIFLFSSF